MHKQELTRRNLLAGTAALGAGAMMPGMQRLAVANEPRGKAEHCIMLWLGGGMGQIDTFDPRPKGDPKKKKPGGYYDMIPTAVKNVSVSEHLHRCADRMDRITAVRTVHHDVIDEHAAAVNRMHTGRPTSGTIVYPSIGSIVAHELGVTGNVPAYVLAGYPNLTRGPGFLGAQYSYLYLTDTESGPAGLQPAKSINADRQQRRQRMLADLRADYLRRNPGQAPVADYDATLDKALRLAGPEFMDVFNLQSEPASLIESYGSELGKRCLLARRLCQSGVRFVEVAHNLNFVNGTGWDVHNQGILKQHVLINELDMAVSTLMDDLEAHNMLDKTLIVISGDFGRPGSFDGGGGRGHHCKAFTVVLAGGGLKHTGAYGQTNDLAEEIVSDPVSVPDLFATIFASLGIDPGHELHDGDRPVPITDMGKPIKSLLA